MFSLGITSAAYIAASVLFILSLGGLSNQESAKRAVWYGIVGMGLAICQTIVKSHGGTLGFQNNPGGGSTFYVTLPTKVT